MQLFLVPLPVLERQQVADRLEGTADSDYLEGLLHPAFRNVASETSRTLTGLNRTEDTRTKQPRMRIYFHWVKEASTLTVTPGLCRGNDEREYQDTVIKRP
jgi:hypothetical protein